MAAAELGVEAPMLHVTCFLLPVLRCREFRILAGDPDPTARATPLLWQEQSGPEG